MKLLALDTSTATASIVLVEDGRVVAETTQDMATRNADLLLAIDRVCNAPRELDAIAVGAGPGSFTGLRIGMATAKGIAFAAQRPLWAVSSLAALAHGYAGLVAAVLDARKGEVFAGVYRDGELLAPERVLPPAELAAFVAPFGEPTHVVGDALAAHGAALAAFADRWHHATPRASAVAALALAGTRADVLLGGVPSYIRASEAEIRYPDGVPGALRKP